MCAPINRLLICMTPGCWKKGSWKETRTGGDYCGPCAAVRAVNHLIEDGYDADHIESVFGIRHVDDRQSAYEVGVGATTHKADNVLIPENE